MASTPVVAPPPSAHIPSPTWLAVRRRVLRTAFHLLYNQLSFAYDTVASAVSAGLWHRWRCTALEHVRGPRVLEIACGPGHLLIEMIKHGYTCSAIDRSPAMLKHARTNLQRHLPELADRIPLHEGIAQELPFADASFESVVMTFPAEFVRDETTLREISRVLVPGGHLVVVEDAQLPVNRLLPKICNWALAQTNTSRVNLHALIPNERLAAAGLHGGWQATCGEFGVVRMLVARKLVHNTVEFCSLEWHDICGEAHPD